MFLHVMQTKFLQVYYDVSVSHIHFDLRKKKQKFKSVQIIAETVVMRSLSPSNPELRRCI